MRSHSRLLLTGILLLFPLFATSADEEPTPLVLCRELSYIAKEVMTYRQNDRPMSEALVKATGLLLAWGKQFGADMDAQKAEELAAGLVIMAYDVMISTPPFQPTAITQFENTAFEECYKARTSSSED